MTRHGKNSTAGAVYTYHEKQKDSQKSGYGTNSQRLGKDSVRSFDCCCLSLQPCRHPMITPDGFLYDKESLLEYIITKKNENSRKMKEFERQRRLEESEAALQVQQETQAKVSKFVQQEKDITVKSTFDTKKVEAGTSISNMVGGKADKVPSFWIPSQTPQAKKSVAVKPDQTVYCPMSGRPLKMKDMIVVKFTEIKDPSDMRSTIVKDARYMCPVTRDTLGNSVPCAVIRTTGDVVTMDCVEKIIKKDWIHPLSGQKLTEKDIILLQRGGTGYSSTNEHLEAKQARPALQV